MALDAGVDIQHDGLKPTVIPPGRQRIHQFGKGGILLQMLVSLLQRPGQDAVFQNGTLAVVPHPEVGLKVDAVPLLPHKSRTKGVDCGDLCAVDDQLLAVQKGIAGIRGQPVVQFVHDLPPQLGGGGLGVGDDQKTIQIQMLLLDPVQ